MEQTETEKYRQEVLQDYYDEYKAYRNGLTKDGFLSYQIDGIWSVHHFDTVPRYTTQLARKKEMSNDEKEQNKLQFEIAVIHAHMNAAKKPLQWDNEEHTYSFKAI